MSSLGGDFTQKLNCDGVIGACQTEGRRMYYYFRQKWHRRQGMLSWRIRTDDMETFISLYAIGTEIESRWEATNKLDCQTKVLNIILVMNRENKEVEVYKFQNS